MKRFSIKTSVLRQVKLSQLIDTYVDNASIVYGNFPLKTIYGIQQE